MPSLFATLQALVATQQATIPDPKCAHPRTPGNGHAAAGAHPRSGITGRAARGQPVPASVIRQAGQAGVRHPGPLAGDDERAVGQEGCDRMRNDWGNLGGRAHAPVSRVPEIIGWREAVIPT